mgnify:CR=1 FL=1
MFRLGTKEFTRRILTNLFIALQLAAVFFIIISIISSIRTRTTLYYPIKKYLQSDGAYVKFSSFDLGEHGLSTKEDIKEFIPEIDEIIAPYTISLDNGENTWPEYRVYDKQIGEKYTPPLEEGNWLDFDEEDKLTAVIDYHSPYQVGEVIELEYVEYPIEGDYFTTTSRPVKVEIVGRLTEKAGLYGIDRSFTREDDFRDLYGKYEPSDRYTPLFLMTEKAVRAQEIEMALTTVKGLVTFKEGLSKEKAEAAFSRLHAVCEPIEMKVFAVRTKRYVYDQLIQLSPILISIIMLVTVSTIAISALNAKMGMKTNAVYALLGCTMNSCVRIYLVNCLLTALTSTLMCALFVTAMKLAGKLRNTVIAFTLPEFMGCGVMLLLFLVCAIGSPLIYLSKATIKEQLTLSE